MYIFRSSHLFLALCFLTSIVFFSAITPHGFGEHTLVKAGDGPYFWSIEQVVHCVVEGKKQYVASYDQDANEYIKKRVTAAGFSQTNCYCRLTFDDCSSRSLECTPTQLFYRIDDHQWVAASMLHTGDLLLCDGDRIVEVANITLVQKSLTVYMLEVKGTHTFLVTEYGVVAHNMLVPVATAIGFSVPLHLGCGGASLGALMGPVGIVGGVVIGGVIGYLINACIKSTIAEYELSFKPHAIATFMEANKNGSKDDESKEKSSEAQAPGKPTENDGFVPKKNWDDKKVKHRRGYGWPDKKGSIWIPTGPNGHGGPHWDVQHPDGSYDNVVPGGGIRGKK